MGLVERHHTLYTLASTIIWSGIGNPCILLKFERLLLSANLQLT